MADRLIRIFRCMEEINKCLADEEPGLLGAMVGELDWLEELHYLLYEGA